MMEQWKDISTAPRDGSLIVVGHDDVGAYTMRWGHIQRKGLFAPGVVGMWVLDGGGMTWNEADGDGPSHWMEFPGDEAWVHMLETGTLPRVPLSAA